MDTSAQIGMKWRAVSPKTIAAECSREHIKSVIQDAKDTIVALTAEAQWTAAATNVVYRQALFDSRRSATAGTSNTEAESIVGVLHLLHMIDDVQYMSYKNEVRFLISRDWERTVLQLKKGH